MRKLILPLFILVTSAPASQSWAIDGNALALKSNNTIPGVGATTLNDNGYVGTYITLAAPGSVTVTVNAQGTAFNSIDPFMNIVIGDAKQGWSVPAGAANYQHTFDLPAGTHLVRTEFNNDLYTEGSGSTARALRINTLDVSGATVSNSNTSTNAFNAAETYTQNYRRGDATLYMPAVEAGTPVQVKLKSHEFNFGAGVPTGVLTPNPAPGTTAARFQQALVDNRFNSLTPGNAGKWSSNEATRDVQTLSSMDQVYTYAELHGLRARAHNLIWGPKSDGTNNQQPGWAFTMMTNPYLTDSATGMYNYLALRGEISERIQYYVANRADNFYEIDVYNESYHTGPDAPGYTYWDIYTPSGIASIYKEVKDAIATAGSTAKTYVNEFNVFNTNSGLDYYANWFIQNMESIQSAGKVLYGDEVNVVDGIGFQYYANGISTHDPARIYAAMNNMAVQGLAMHLTEWGVSGTASDPVQEANAAIILEDTARLVFGMPGVSGMTLWDLRNSGAFAPVGTLYESNWTIRDTGIAWQALMDEWDTDLTVNVNPDGTIDFNGFYGDYEITIGSQTFDLTLGKGGASDFLFYDYTIPGDVDGDGDADIDDLVAVKNHLGDTGVGFGMGDTDGDGDVDGMDLANVKDNFGMAVTPGPPPGLAVIPEPATGVLALAGGAAMLVRRRRSR